MRSSMLLIPLALAPAAQPATAGPGPDDRPASRVLFFSGVDLSTLSVFSWGGVDAAVLGPRDRSGPVVRLMGGRGNYQYRFALAPEGRVLGTVMLGEVLAGWRHIGAEICLTGLAGAEIEDHQLDVPDPENAIQGTETGARFAAELSWRLSQRTRVEASAAYGSAFDFYRLRLAGDYRIWRTIAAGAEAEAFGNAASDQIRLGLFASGIRAGRLEFRAGAGVLHDGDDIGAYGRLGINRTY